MKSSVTGSRYSSNLFIILSKECRLVSHPGLLFGSLNPSSRVSSQLHMENLNERICSIKNILSCWCVVWKLWEEYTKKLQSWRWWWNIRIYVFFKPLSLDHHPFIAVSLSSFAVLLIIARLRRKNQLNILKFFWDGFMWDKRNGSSLHPQINGVIKRLVSQKSAYHSGRETKKRQNLIMNERSVLTHKYHGKNQGNYHGRRRK